MANILGVSIGTRNVGIAVIRLRRLRDYRIRSFPGKWTQEKRRRILEIIESIIIPNGITDITYKIPGKNHCSEGIEELICDIQSLALDYGLTVHECTTADLRVLYANAERGTRRVVADALRRTYPLLKGRWHGSSRAQSYNAKLFEAIACAELALRAGH